MLRSLPILLFSLFLTMGTQAQETRYVSDQVFIVLHKGPGAEYRWAAKLTPGTRLNAGSTQGDWTEVTTARGTPGWVRTEFLTAERPAQVQLTAAVARADQLSEQNATLSSDLGSLQAEKNDLLNRIASTEAELAAVSGELSELKTISGNAVQLDVDNRRLVEESEKLRADVDTLEAENLRLNDKLKSEAFMNGALAVLLGVIITLVVPRLWPKRRKPSSWGSSW